MVPNDSFEKLQYILCLFFKYESLGKVENPFYLILVCNSSPLADWERTLSSLQASLHLLVIAFGFNPLASRLSFSSEKVSLSVMEGQYRRHQFSSF